MPAPRSAHRHKTPLDPSTLHRHLRMVALFMLVLLTGLIAGIVMGRSSTGHSSSGPSLAGIDTVEQVLLNDFYYRPIDDAGRAAFEQQLWENAISGMLGGLGDQYTSFLPPAEAHVAADQLDGEYGGVGVTVTIETSSLTVIQVEPGSAASKAGLAAGDSIEQVDHQPATSAAGIADGSDLTGPVGSTVELIVRKHDSQATLDLTLKREAVVVHQVTWEQVPGTRYLHIRIGIFGDRTVPELDEALVYAADHHLTGLILDLRGNGGGWVSSAQQTLGRFLPGDTGPALYEDTMPGAGGEQALPIEVGDVTPTALPLVVLVDGDTASAAEIVAGALHDYDRGLVVGDVTYGKGSVQRVFNLNDGSSLRVTVGEWLTPSRNRIQGRGIQPDLAVGSARAASIDGDHSVGVAVQCLDLGISTPRQVEDATPPAPAPVSTPTT